MIEVNRNLYMDETTGSRRANFDLVAASVQDGLRAGLEAWLTR